MAAWPLARFEMARIARSRPLWLLRTLYLALFATAAAACWLTAVGGDADWSERARVGRELFGDLVAAQFFLLAGSAFILSSG